MIVDSFKCKKKPCSTNGLLSVLFAQIVTPNSGQSKKEKTRLLAAKTSTEAYRAVHL